MIRKDTVNGVDPTTATVSLCTTILEVSWVILQIFCRLKSDDRQLSAVPLPVIAVQWVLIMLFTGLRALPPRREG